MNKEIWLSHFEEVFMPVVSSHKGFITNQCQIAGRVIRIHYSSPELKESLSMALAHREIGVAHPEDFEIFVIKRGDLPAADMKFDKLKSGSPRFHWYFHGDSSVINLFCVEKNCGYYLISNDQPTPHWVISSPFRKIFDWYLGSLGLHVIHGAAVGNRESAVLITGASGAGKSTIAMHCAAQGMSYLADDYIAIDESGNAHALYSSLKVLRDNPVTVDNFGFEIPATGDKRVLFLGDSFSGQLPSSLPLKGVIVPFRSQVEHIALRTLEQQIRARTLSAFALKQSPWINRESSEGILRAMSRLPAFLLEYQGHPQAIPPLLVSYCDSIPPSDSIRRTAATM